MHLDEYMDHDACGLADLVKAGETTPSELLELARQRLRQVNPRLNAVIREMTMVADRRVGEDLSGPLAGVPFLLKDIAQEYKGEPATYGSRALRNNIAKEHSTVVQRWLDAGLVVFGQTNTPEFGAKGITEPDFRGTTRNPWNLGRTPGGSSGGSAAAVAAGVVPAAGANDGGGSIRIPAACCGLVGLKPGRGVTPFGPTFGEQLDGMVVQGSLTRSVRDTAALFDAIAGPEAVWTYPGQEPGRPMTELIREDPRPLRVGFSDRSLLRESIHPEATTAMTNVARLLEGLGHDVEEVPMPVDDRSLARDFLTIWFASLAVRIATIKRETGASNDDFEADSLAMAELGRANGAIRLGEAIARRHEHVRRLADFHADYDLLLTPTLAEPPIEIARLDTPWAFQVGSRIIAALRGGEIMRRFSLVDRLVDENLGWVPYTQLANLTGRPAISLPLHWTSDGLPLGVQFVAAVGGEGTLLQLAAQLEKAQPWWDRRPVLA